MAWKKNIIKADLKSYPPYLIMGIQKVGKTTLFRDLVLYNYKTEDKGLLISFADEEGYLALDKIQVEKVEDWEAELDEETGLRGFVQVVDDLVENKEQYGIEMIGLDTLDKMVDVANREVFEIHRRLKGTYPKSLNDALGGYGAGGRKGSEIILQQIARLRKAGYAVFILAHTKRKDKTDLMTGEQYEQLTNNLMSTYYNPVADGCQMIVNINVDRVIAKDGTTFLNKQNKEEQHGRQVETVRMMYFRDNGFVDAGGRFTGLPDKLELSAENFMQAFEQGVRNSMLDTHPTDSDIAKMKKEENKELEKVAKIAKEKEAKAKEVDNSLSIKQEIISEFQKKATSLKSEQLSMIKDINEQYGIKNYSDLESIPMEAVQKIKEIISK